MNYDKYVTKLFQERCPHEPAIEARQCEHCIKLMIVSVCEDMSKEIEERLCAKLDKMYSGY